MTVASTDADTTAQVFLSQIGKAIRLSSEKELEIAGEMIHGGTFFTLMSIRKFVAQGVQLGLSKAAAKKSFRKPSAAWQSPSRKRTN